MSDSEKKIREAIKPITDLLDDWDDCLVEESIKAILQHSQQEQERVVKQARADQLKKLWNATQHDIVPEGTPPRDMSEELHKMIKELEE